MPKQKRFKTDEKGVYFIEVDRLDKPGKLEKMYYFYFRDELGRQREEKAGRQFGPEKMTSTKARDKRSDRMRGITQSRQEIKAEEKAHKLEEDSRPTFKNLWKEYSQTLNKSLAADRSRFEKHLQDLHDKTPDEIITLDIERIKNRLKKAKLTPQTVKHCLVLIERIVNHGLEQHPPRCKPLMFKIKKPKFDNRVTEFLE
ncbi:MAG: site-specific integrase, partial [Pseudomonadota bacterium]|nr:site-specific integrase [Pseudomonadota bacterium]